MAANLGAYAIRALNTLWQAFLSSLSLTQLIPAISGGDLGATERILLAAAGAAIAALITFLKNVAFQPITSGFVGMAERALATFVAGAASAVSVEYIAAAISNADLRGLQSAGLAALSGGIAAVLSLVQHLPKAGTPAVVPAHPFTFRNNDGTDLTAKDVGQFISLAPVVSDATWIGHLRAHDYSTWIGSSLGNPALAAAVRAIEDSGDSPSSTRLQTVNALEAAYGPGAPFRRRPA